MAEWIGQQIGNYRITGLLGEGGMAAVYRAERLTIRSDVAIKLIKPGLVSSEKLDEFTRRFTREAETIARLSHPHILKMFDYGQHKSIIYLVMELLPGGSLADLIKRGPLPLPDAARRLDQITDALDYAHEQGIVHRDLKPENVLLDSRGNAILTDFGIAKLLNETTALTQNGLAMGTPTYMSPEQCQGQQVDARSDLYSLGVILFQMLTGDVPFKADTPVSLLYLHISQPPPNLSEYRQVPEAVERVLSKALAKRPQDRFSSAGELAAAFRTALTGQMPVGLDAVRSGVGNDLTARTPAIGIPFPPPQPSTTPAQRRRGGLLALGVVALVAMLIAVGLLLAGRNPEAAPVAQAPSTDTALPLIVQIPTGTSTENPTPTNAPTNTPSTTPTVTSTLTPTDTLMDPLAAVQATLAQDNTKTAVAQLSWSPTPSNTFTPTPTPSNTLDVAATVAKVMEQTQTANAVTSTLTTTFTPSSTPTEPPTQTNTATATASDTPTKPPTLTLTATGTPTAIPTATPEAVAMLLTNLQVIRDSNATQITEVARWGKDTIYQVTWSPDGKQVALAGRLGVWLYQVEAPEAAPRHLQGHTEIVECVAFSPDGRLLVSGSRDNTVRVWDVSSGRELRTLSGHTRGVLSVAFSSDGLLLASGSRDQTIRIWDMSSARRLRTLSGHTDWVKSVAFSPDGRLLASGSDDTTVWLWEVRNGREVSTLSSHTQGVYSVAFSPDGRLLASGSDDNTVRIWDVSSGDRLRTLSGHTREVFSVAFSPDGRLIASGSGDNTVRVWDVSSGQILHKLSGHAAEVTSVAFSPDGRLIASGSGDGTIRLWGVR